MSVSRGRLQQIAELAFEGAEDWEGLKTSSLASWVRDLAVMVVTLDEGQERLESDLGALSDAVDEIVDGIEGVDVDPLYPEHNDYSDEPKSGHGIVNLTTVPYLVDNDLWLNEARLVGGKLHVGALFPDLLESAAQAAKNAAQQFGVGDVVRLARHDEHAGAYCIPPEVFFEIGTVLDGPDGYGDYRVMFGRICKSFSVKPSMLDSVGADLAQAAAE